MWTLGGKSSSFRLGPGASFAFQHDVRVQAFGDQFLTMFDDGAGPPYVHSQSRALKLELNLKHMTADVVSQRLHSPPLLSSGRALSFARLHIVPAARCRPRPHI